MTGPTSPDAFAPLPAARRIESPAGLLARLAAAGIAAHTVNHPPVFTVAESRHLHAAMPGAHTKNLFLKPAKGAGPYLLATLEAERQASVNALARAAGWPRVAMASGAELEAVLGVPPGSVTPFGLVNAAPGAVRFAIDAALLAAATIWVHPLSNAASTGLAPGELVRFLAALGHATTPLALDQPA